MLCLLRNTFINGSLTGNLAEPHKAVCSSIWATPVLSIGVVRKFTENALLSSLHAMWRYLALVFLCTSKVASMSNSCNFRSSTTCQAWWGEVRAAAGAVERGFLCIGTNLLTWSNLIKLLMTLQQKNQILLASQQSICFSWYSFSTRAKPNTVCHHRLKLTGSILRSAEGEVFS